jgi:hypothetical protein
MHADTAGTHIISAILHIDHDLDEDWPLEIEDHQVRIRHIPSLSHTHSLLPQSLTLCLLSRLLSCLRVVSMP